MLDFRYNYGDGHLAQWTTRELEEFLLDWCPRKLTADDESIRELVASVSSFMRFLAANGLLEESSDEADTLAARPVTVNDEFFAAMHDPSKFGMAKSMFSAMGGPGLDVADQATLDGLMAEFNALPFEERDRILGPSMDRMRQPQRPRVDFMPVVLPSDQKAAELSAATRIVAQARALLEFVGPGRPLTQAGNLKLADGKALVALLDTGDEVDPTFTSRRTGRSHSMKTRSSTELQHLDNLLEWFVLARIVDMDGPKIVPSALAPAVAADPARVIDELADTLVDFGALHIRFGERIDTPNEWMAPASLIDFALPALFPLMLAGQGEMPFEFLAESLWEDLQRSYPPQAEYEEFVHRSLARDLAWFFEPYEAAGLVERDDVEEVPDDYTEGRFDRLGGTVALTWLGTRFAARLAQRQGYEVPIAGALREHSAELLLAAFDDRNEIEARAELDAWVAHRAPSAAAAELAVALRARASKPDAFHDPVVFWVMTAINGRGDEATAAVRSLLDIDATRSLALVSLVGAGAATDTEREQSLQPNVLVDVLGAFAQHEETMMMPFFLGLDGPLEIIEEMWRVDRPATALVLDTIGRAHPDASVAKAARKAAIKHRSFMANRHREP